MVTIIFSAAMLMCGVLAVIMAFKVLGKPQGQERRPQLLTVHRLFGYLFILIFLALFIGMAGRFSWANSFSLRADIHVALAIATAALLIVKLAAARRFKKFVPYFFPLGVLILVLSFSFVGIAAGGYIGGKVGFSPAGMKADVSVDSGQVKDGFPAKVLPEEKKFVQLCGACHPIGQVIYPLRNETKAEQWPEIVKGMQEKTNLISDEDAKRMVDYLQQFYP